MNSRFAFPQGACLRIVRLLAALAICLHPVVRGSDLLLTEFVASDNNALKDEEGDSSDWIEVFNPGSEPVDLSGWALTDDPDEPARWIFPAQPLGPGEFLVVFASGKDRREAGRPLHTDFRLDADGEYLALVRVPDRTPVQQFSPRYPQQRAGLSFGLPSGAEPGAGFAYLDPPTPGAPNGEGYTGWLEPPVFSLPRGFYGEPFELELSAPGAELIRYTLDGSAPSATEGLVYEGPIRISGSTVVRAFAWAEGHVPSPVVTHTYIFPASVLAQSADPPGFPKSWGGVEADYEMDPDILQTQSAEVERGLRALPTVAIAAANGDLFDPDRGIYSHPQEHGDEWERPASMEWINPDGTTEFQINCGLRIQGGYFRMANVTGKHSLRVAFRSAYGPDKLRHDVFKEEGAVREFDGFVLRAGANDGYAWDAAKDTEQFLRDEFGRRLQLAMGHPAARGVFVHVYLNGLYWGLYNLCERPDEHFSAAYLGGEPEDWDVDNAGEIKNGNDAGWKEFLRQVREASDAEDYYRLQGLGTDGRRDPALPVLLDAVNYIDYMILNIWGGNWDWPNKNYWHARNRSDAGTGFKFYVWDFENTVGNNRARSPLNMVAPRADVAALGVGEPHHYLKNLPEYRRDFADRVRRHLLGTGVLTPDSLIARYRQLAARVEAAIPAETARWGDDHYPVPQDFQDWLRERNWVLNEYLPQRTGIVLDQFRKSGLFTGLEVLRSETGELVVRGWMDSAASWSLEQSSEIGAGDAWQPVGPIEPQDGFFEVRVPTSDGRRFFRLIRGR